MAINTRGAAVMLLDAGFQPEEIKSILVCIGSVTSGFYMIDRLADYIATYAK